MRRSQQSGWSCFFGCLAAMLGLLRGDFRVALGKWFDGLDRDAISGENWTRSLHRCIWESILAPRHQEASLVPKSSI